MGGVPPAVTGLGLSVPPAILATVEVEKALRHTKIESTVSYLGVDVKDAPVLAEGTET